MGAARSLVRIVLGTPAALPPELAARFPELRLASYRRGGLPPRVGGWLLGRSTVAGVTLWNTIFLARRAPMSAELLLHELRHVQQFGASPAFPFRYAWETLRRGYTDNRYELDARTWAAARLRAAPGSPPAPDT